MAVKFAHVHRIPYLVSKYSSRGPDVRRSEEGSVPI